MQFVWFMTMSRHDETRKLHQFEDSDKGVMNENS